MSGKIRRLPFVSVEQDGDDGVNATFHVDRFDEVARIMKPRRRRRLSPEQREACGRRLAKFRFQPARQAPQNNLERTQTGRVDPEHQFVP
jgi:hypothetical protein